MPKKTPNKRPKRKTSASGEVQILPPLVTNKITTIKMPIGTVDTVGQDIINDILYDCGLTVLPDWWDYSTQVRGKGEYVGSFCKRVAKYYWKTNKTKFSSNILGKLGSVLSNHSDNNSEYIIDYTQDLHSWNSGDFGDHESCFWTCNSAARNMLEEDGAWAIRFYDGVFKPDKRFKRGYNSRLLRGCGRAWICQRHISSGRTKKYYIVFNGYGIDTANITRIMATSLNLSYRKINLRNKGSQHGLLYINGYGYAVGPESIIYGLKSVDLDICDNSVECCECERRVLSANAILYNDEYYCPVCYANFRICDLCGKNYSRNNLWEINHEHLCSECRDTKYTWCGYCGAWELHKNVRRFDYSDVCLACYNRLNFQNTRQATASNTTCTITPL